MAGVIVRADFRVLGPLEAVLNGVPIEVGHRRQRLILGVLLLEAGRHVPFDRLIELAWFGEEPPRTARNALQVGVSKLRSTLGDAAQIVTVGEAYRIEVPPDSVDAHRFRALVQQARQAADQPAIDLYRQAAGLWRGPVLADTFNEEIRRLLCGGLSEEQVRANEERIDLELRLGMHRHLISELTDLVRTYPTRERAVGQLMVALYRSGRPAEATELYHETRSALVEQLGIEPAPELRSLYVRILNEDPRLAPPSEPTPTTAPRRFLPRDIPDFTGREAELRLLDQFASGDAGGTLVIGAVAGVAGVGKTALAIHWAHRIASRFPDGQLYLDLRGYDMRSPLLPLEALGRLLRALGVSSKQVPNDVDEAAALYRDTMDGKRILVLLDNARSVEQVRPLLPGDPRCLVLITSRDALAGLIARDGARRLTLEVLQEHEAIRLLEQILGASRVAFERKAAAQLCARCGYLPLALRVAAANLAGRPDMSIEMAVAELDKGSRIGALAVDGDPHSSVRAVFDQSYWALPQPVQRQFGHIGLLVGADFTAEAVSALADIDVVDVAALLRHLTDAHLVMQRTDDRFAIHDLVREYALERYRADHTTDDAEAAFLRLLDWYVASVDAATQPIRRFPVPVRMEFPPPRAAVPGVADLDAALAWLDAEHGNLMAAAQLGASEPFHAHVVQLAHLLHPYFLTRGLIPDWIAVVRLAEAATSKLDDDVARAHTLVELGWVSEMAGRIDHVQELYGEARELSRSAGNVEGEARSLTCLGGLYRRLGQYAEAADHHRGAVNLFLQTTNRVRLADSLNGLSVDLYLMGKHEEALEQGHRALELEQQIGGAGERSVRTNLGRMYARLGRHAEAVEHTAAALDSFRRSGGGIGMVMAMSNLAYSYARLGRQGEAIELCLEALDTARALAFLDTEAAVLNTLGEAYHLAGNHAEAVRRHKEALAIGDAEEIKRAEDGIARASGLT